MVVRRFEDLEVWQLADELKKKVYALVDRSNVRSDRRFCDQITASAASAPANLAEGFGYYRHPEFAKHTRIAKSSLMETQNHLRDGVDRGLWSAPQCDPLLHLADRAIGKCVRLLNHLETSAAPGTDRPNRTSASRTCPPREATTHNQLAETTSEPPRTTPGPPRPRPRRDD
jgi:four helix bundle protein